jgi:hypothetical protein
VADIQVQVAQVQSHIDKHGREEVLNWLCPHDYSNQLKINVDLHKAGTGQWFLEDPHFINWKTSSSSSTLFCPGAPGTGKTVMSAQVVIDLQQNFSGSGKPVVYLFCDYKMRTTQKTDDLIANVIRQLGFSSSEVSKRLASLWDENKAHNSRLSRSDLEREAEEAFAIVGATYVVIDALDECQQESRSDLIQMLSKIASRCTIHLLATARGQRDIEVLFDGSPKLAIQAADDDIKMYAVDRAKGFDLALDHNLCNEVVKAVVDASDGM